MYYDFSQLVYNTEIIIKNQEDLLSILFCFTFIFTIFLVYYFVRNMIKGG